MFYIRANAKINLHLKITGKRIDGYHLLESIFQEIDLFDEINLEFIDKKEINLFLEGEFSNISIEKNLVYIATKKFFTEFCIDKGVNIYLKKNIPIGAGLGGGSSDVANCLMFYKKYFDVKINYDDFLRFLLNFGADVPFFLRGGRCFVKGIGEKIEKIENYEKYFIVLVYPKIELSTKKIYDKFDELYNENLIKKDNDFYLTRFFKIDTIFNNFSNDLEKSAIFFVPQIKEIKKNILEYGSIFSLMSGSGSCIFGIVDNKEKAFRIKKILKDKYASKYWIQVVYML